MNDTQENYEALLQFLYLAPVGLKQTNDTGAVVLINPRSAQLLMPLSREGNLDNLFDVLAEVAPDCFCRMKRKRKSTPRLITVTVRSTAP